MEHAIAEFPDRDAGATSLDALVRDFEHTLAMGGLHEALRWLNGRTRYRFTGIYRFEPPWLRNVAMFDRENPELRLCDDALMRETYCALVADREAPVTVEDGDRDPRAAVLPPSRPYRAYCGVPLRDASGDAIGTLCHFDPRPRLAGALDQALLERAAGRLAPLLPVRAFSDRSVPPGSPAR